MFIIECKNGQKHQIQINTIESNDFELLTRQRYFFNWELEQDYELYKLNKKNESDILGLISFYKIPEEWRIHIRLLTVSVENVGKEKKYELIAANLITHVAKIALREYAELACVSLKPKGQIAQHYIDTYDMNITGATLSIELTEILNLIKTYDND